MAKSKTPKPLVFKIYSDTHSEWRWQLKSPNGRIIADSAEGYKRPSHCRKMVALIQDTAHWSKVEDPQ